MINRWTERPLHFWSVVHAGDELGHAYLRYYFYLRGESEDVEWPLKMAWIKELKLEVNK